MSADNGYGRQELDTRVIDADMVRVRIDAAHKLLAMIFTEGQRVRAMCGWDRRGLLTLCGDSRRRY